MIDELKSFSLPAKWIAKLGKQLHRLRKRRGKELDFLNNFAVVNTLAREYVEPECQDINPADREEEAVGGANRKPIFARLQETFNAPNPADPNGSNQLFILSDAGMGKTSLLVMLRLGYLNRFWPFGYRCVLMKLGEDTLDALAKLEEPRNTILLLDSLDEDPTAWGRVEDRIVELLHASKRVRKVVITCRTQFFPDENKDKVAFKQNRVAIGGFWCPVLYLSLFSDDQVDRYLRKRFLRGWRRFLPVGKRELIRKAKAIVAKMDTLKMRPMLLAYIDKDFLDRQIDTGNEYAIFRELLDVWIRREALKKVKPGLVKPDPSELWSACGEAALFMHRENTRYVPKATLTEHVLSYPHLSHIDKVEITGRSLLNKNSDGDYRFAHFSVQEFLLVHKAITDETLILPEPLKTTDQMRAFMSGFLAGGGRPQNRRWLELLGRPSLAGANLAGVDLRGMDLLGVDLMGVNLSGANLSGASLKNARLKDLSVSGGEFDGVVRETTALELPGGVSIRLVRIFPGSFLMGSPADEVGRNKNERQHRATLTDAFWLGETPVTQAQWQALMGDNPSGFKSARRPVEQVSWDDAQRFIEALNQRFGEGGAFRLPTEAEWEYACRAGSGGPYAGKLEDMGWFKGNSGKKTHDVALKDPNAWGLYDMHGNVWEWCADGNSDYPKEAVVNPRGPETGSDRVVRGGGWIGDAWFCRSASRGWGSPVNCSRFLGFRLLRMDP